MMYDGKIKAWVMREKWKRKIMPYEQKFTASGKEYSTYNFMVGLTKKIFDFVIDDLTKSGIPLGQIPTIMARSGLTEASIKRKLKGKEETHLYELEPLLKTVNYSIRSHHITVGEIFKVVKSSPNYTYTQELNRIILKRNIYPEFFINFNPDKPTDFEVDFGKEEIINHIGENKMIRLVLEAIGTFYEAEKKSMKGMEKNVKTEIRRQYLNSEIIIKNKPSTR